MRRETHSNYRVVINPDLRNTFPRGSHDAARAVLDDLAAQIRRDVVDVDVTAQWDPRIDCSHCGYEWEELTADAIAANPADHEGAMAGEPVCCDEAIAEFRAQAAAQLRDIAAAVTR